MAAVVFDFDGTIVDTETPEFRSWREIYGSFDLDLTLGEWAQAVGTGPGAFDPLAVLQERVGHRLDLDLLLQRHRERHRDLMREEGLRPGVSDLLAACSRRGVLLGIASSSRRAWVVSNLRRFGILSAFRCIATADDVLRVKPAPDLYLLALARLGVRAEEAVAIEDSPNGALAAKEAGLKCVAVPNDVTRSYPFPAVDLVRDRVPDLAEILALVAERPTGS